jgi:hypothetical protein
MPVPRNKRTTIDRLRKQEIGAVWPSFEELLEEKTRADIGYRRNGNFQVLIMRLCNLVRDKESEIATLRRLFDVQQRRVKTAVKLWRQENKGAELIMPDLGDLVVWLLERTTFACGKPLCEVDNTRSMEPCGALTTCSKCRKRKADIVKEAKETDGLQH